jgi:hypothetical protein
LFWIEQWLEQGQKWLNNLSQKPNIV